MEQKKQQYNAEIEKTKALLNKARDYETVRMIREYICKLIIGHTGRQLFSDFVCFLRRDLIRLESLTDMIDQNFIFDFPAGVLEILLSVQHEFINRRFRHAGV